MVNRSVVGRALSLATVSSVFSVAIAITCAASPSFAEGPAGGATGVSGSATSPDYSQDVVAPKLTSISFESIGPGENVLVAELSQPPQYSLKRTAPSEYVLRIKGSQIAMSNSGTLMAAPESGLIRSARAVVDGGDITLRIFAAPTTNLSARTSGNRIVLTASPFASDETRAQPKADAGKKSAEKTAPAPADGSEDARWTGRLISLDLQDTDIANALRIIAEVSNLNIITTDDVTGKVTLRLIDVPWDQALDVILRTNGLDKVQDGNVVRIAPVDRLKAERESLKQSKQAEEELKDLNVKYFRVSYAKSSDIKTLAESVVSERGSVAFDERTNQLIVKDIDTGIDKVKDLIAKLDLRTPQVLLESQVVEVNRTFSRDLGSELGFSLKQTTATGNPTGYNFPNDVIIQGSGAGNIASSFPAGGANVSFLLGSADGTASLTAKLSALEEESKVKVISRPSVATTNNQAAVIKSVTKIRVKNSSGGVSVGVGQGANAGSGGSSGSATESIEAGITLEVTPQASPDYFVLLDVKAKSSSFNFGQQVSDIPSEIERSATSSVLVSSGQTFVMGGIYRSSINDKISGVPFFKDIPVLGTFFRLTRYNEENQEVIFFVTPRIVEGSFDDATMRMANLG